MNDKRCPACDLLIDENAANCSCQFVFWDDTPDHVITFGRILFSATLLMSAGVIGFKLSNPVWAGEAKLGLVALFGVALAFNILPNVRKHGGFALSLATIALASTTFVIGGVSWDVYNHEHKEESNIVERVYDSDLELRMDGLKLGESPPDQIPENVTIEIDDQGKIIAITGRSIDQGNLNLLKTSDPPERLKKSFPGSQNSGRLYVLDSKRSLLVTLLDNRVTQLSLLDGAVTYGSGDTVDGFALGMSESLVRILKRERTTTPEVVFSRESLKVVVGLLGEKLESRDKTVKVGQHIDDVPAIHGGYGRPFVSVLYDAENKVKRVGLGKFDSGIFRAPILSDERSKKLEAKFLYQRFQEADKKNRPKTLCEEWETPVGIVTVIGPSATTAAEYVFQTFPHSKGNNGKRESKYPIGEKSHWTDKECLFFQNGEYFKIWLKTTQRSLQPAEQVYLQDFGRAILEGRGQR